MEEFKQINPQEMTLDKIFDLLDTFNSLTASANYQIDKDEVLYAEYDELHEEYGKELETYVDGFVIDVARDYPDFDQNRIEDYQWELLDGIINGRYSKKDLIAALQTKTFLDLIGQGLK